MKLVLVEWNDSHERNGWVALDILKKFCKPSPCRSVGWLLEDKNGHIQLVSHISGMNLNKEGPEDACGDMCIPKKVITKMTVLRKK